jgi:hypothetical protein
MDRCNVGEVTIARRLLADRKQRHVSARIDQEQDIRN